MITYKKLSKNPKAFQVLTGLTVTEFDELYTVFEPAWFEAEFIRLSRADRQRQIGAGAKYNLTLRNHVLMVLFWLRLYLTTEAVGCFFGLNKSNVSRNGRRLLTVLRQVSDTEFEWPDPPPRGQGRSVQQAFQQTFSPL